MQNKLKVLCLDIENFPCLVYSWGLGEQNIPLEFLVRDWSICAWGAQWLGSDKTMYMDNRHKKNIYDDKALVKGLIKLINQADVVIGQNVKGFDLRKVAARADFHKLKPFKPCRVTDILLEERKVFALTSHKLAYKTRRNEKYRKLEHKEFPGFDLWKATMDDLGDYGKEAQMKAWKAMQEYCEYDVRSTGERYLRVAPWIKTHHEGFFADGKAHCKCGSTNLKPDRYVWTDAGKFRQYLCRDCGKWPRSPINLLTKKQKSVRLREAN